MILSIVIPLLNEEKNIPELIEFLENSKPLEKEVIFVDGNSSDATVESINEEAGELNYTILINIDKTVPYALNMAIPVCQGEYIVRLDGHTTYEIDYLEKIVETFRTTKADIVGGPMRIKGGDSFQNLVGIATSSPLGVGNSKFHFANFKGYTDSVYLGAWKKSIFSSTGLFDVRFVRNQDDEYHYRAKSFGFKIFQDPEIISWYQPRNSFGKLFRQYFMYGKFKPLVLKKIHQGFNLRHLIPSFFSLYLLFLIPAAFLSPLALLPLGVYLILGLFEGVRFKIKATSIFRFIGIFFTLHISYGSGFILGIFKK